MDLVKRNMALKIETKNYGKVTIYLSDDENRIGDGYFVTATKHGKHLSGFVDYLGNEIIPLEEMELDEYFSTLDKENICFGFKLKDTDFLLYYHVQKNSKDNYCIKLSTDPYDTYPIMIHQIKEASDIWVFDMETEDGILSCMYNPYKVRMITPFFNELSFNVDDNPYGHFAYFCDYISSEREYLDNEDEVQTETVLHTSVCGFLDREGNFSSQVLDTEGEEFYSSYFLGTISTSSIYQKFKQQLLIKYQNQFDEKNKRNDNALTYLFNNYNLSKKNDSNKDKQKTKILEFKYRKNS